MNNTHHLSKLHPQILKTKEDLSNPQLKSWKEEFENFKLVSLIQLVNNHYLIYLTLITLFHKPRMNKYLHRLLAQRDKLNSLKSFKPQPPLSFGNAIFPHAAKWNFETSKPPA